MVARLLDNPSVLDDGITPVLYCFGMGVFTDPDGV